MSAWQLARRNRARRQSGIGRFAFLSVIVAPLLMAGCQNIAENTGIYYNDGLAESFNSMLLKNIIRSAKNYPMYHSAIGDFSTDYSTGQDFGPSLDIGDGLDLSLGPSASLSRDRSAGASSLETEQFTQAMHTDISIRTLLFFANGRQRSRRPLIFMLLFERVTIEAGDFRQVLDLAETRCSENLRQLSEEYQAICRDILSPNLPNECPASASERAANGLIYYDFSNDPSNPCEFYKFRLLVDRMVLTEPEVSADSDGQAIVYVGRAPNRTRIFKASGTGAVLRSPHQIVAYLGRIVKQTAAGKDRGLLTVTSPDGNQVPLMLVKEGNSHGTAAVSAVVDDETYWIPRQRLGSEDGHYSLAVLGVIKDIIALNTSQDSLPNTNNRIVIQ